jgi:hypothetical protein
MYTHCVEQPRAATSREQSRIVTVSTLSSSFLPETSCSAGDGRDQPLAVAGPFGQPGTEFIAFNGVESKPGLSHETVLPGRIISSLDHLPLR